ncbi:hypothetical protein ECZU29_63370 [Escherichia coli]|nr:hypothetical protein ECZU29_63370 [Escherichia coli]
MRNDGEPFADPQQDRNVPTPSHATHPAMPHLATKDFAKRASLDIITSAIVAKAKLNPIRNIPLGL